ncbi:MAG: aromatase/cyclase [Armatimonadota bacterium]
MPYVESTITINGPAEKAYNLAKNMEEFPLFMPDVESVKVLERNGNTTITEWITNVEGTPITWKEEDLFDDSNHTITYRLTEGDLDKFEGQWKFEQKDGQTVVTLGVDYDFGIPSLTELIGPTLEVKVKENSNMMLEGLKSRVEQ